MDRVRTIPESWSGEKPEAPSPLVRRFSSLRRHPCRLGGLSSLVRHLRSKGTLSVASLTSNPSHLHLCGVHRRILVPRSDPRLASPNNPSGTGSDHGFCTFLDRPLLESGERTDRSRALGFRFRPVAARILEIYRPPDGPGRLYHDLSSRIYTRTRHHPNALSLAGDWHSFRIDFWQDGI